MVGRKSGPKKVAAALLPLRVLEEAAKGPGWYERVKKRYLGGWRPRHPETGELMNSEACLAWAIATFSDDRAVKVRAARVAAELEKIGFADPGDYFDWGPDGVYLKPGADLTQDQRSAIAEIHEVRDDKGVRLRVKFHDKMPALRMLGQTTGAFVDRQQVTHSVDDGLASLMREIDGRSRGLPGGPVGGPPLEAE